MRAHCLAVMLVAFCCGLCGCDGPHDEQAKSLTLYTCSEAAFLEPHLKRLASKEGFSLTLRYLAVQDLVQDLARGGAERADAVIAPDALWLDLGRDRGNVALGRPVPIMRLPVALGLRQSLATRLGLDETGVDAKTLCDLAGEGRLPYLLASPSQTAAGMAVYLGLAKALSGNEPGPELSGPTREALRALFSGVVRSSGSTLWVKSLFETGGYPAQFNYAHVLAQTAHEAARDGAEPLVVVPVRGTDMACTPVFAAVQKKGAPAALTEKVAAFLTSDEMRAQIAGQGREAPSRESAALQGPALESLLTLYQRELRKPALTVLVVELSGSMKGYAERELKRAVRQALDPGLLAARGLEQTPRDQLFLVVYADKVLRSWRLDNASPDQQDHILSGFDALTPQGGAGVYTALAEAGTLLAKAACQDCLVQVILVPYANPSAQGKTLTQVRQQWQSLRLDVPVQGVLFGEMALPRLDEIVALSRGRIFDGRTDLAQALLAARAYND